jgi:DNA-binding HxlR family transcriptional regulator
MPHGLDLASHLERARAQAPGTGWETRCPVETALDALGGSRALIVWHLFWGARSFAELRRQAAPVHRKSLRAEIAELERQGLLSRRARPGGEAREELALTPRGETLKPVVAAMYDWGLHQRTAARRWCPPPDTRSES